jgi:hypothetical protein
MLLSEYVCGWCSIHSFPAAHLDDILVVAKIACIDSGALCAEARVVHLIDLLASLQDLWQDKWFLHQDFIIAQHRLTPKLKWAALLHTCTAVCVFTHSTQLNQINHKTCRLTEDSLYHQDTSTCAQFIVQIGYIMKYKKEMLYKMQAVSRFAPCGLISLLISLSI